MTATKQMTIKEKEKFVLSSLKNAVIEDSSDFVQVACEINQVIYPSLAQHLSPILTIEKFNDGEDWAENACNSQAMIAPLKLNQVEACMNGYRAALNFMLLDEEVSEVFPMDEIDFTGWRIWRELDAKYRYAKKLFEILTYRKEHGID